MTNSTKHLCTLFCCLILSTFIIIGCKPSKTNTLKVAATAVPHAEILEHIKPNLKQKGIELEIIYVDDFNMPNRALADQQIDANFFQHQPFLTEQIKQFNYKLTSIAQIEIEPMGIYSTKIKSLAELTPASVVAVPSDPTNEARALMLLQKHGLLKLKDYAQQLATILDITDNPQQLKFIEVDAAMLARSLNDVSLAVINTNYALQANLSPLHDAIALEDQSSVYTNILVVRQGDEQRADLQALKAILQDSITKEFILNKYHGAVLPAF